MKKRVRWKVVYLKNNKRYSCIMPPGSKYCLEYIKGEIVEAMPGTHGIMVFKSKHFANNFLWGLSSVKIIKVRVIGRRKKIICLGEVRSDNPALNTAYLNKFYRLLPKGLRPDTSFRKLHQLFNGDFMIPPKGTECYPAVKVLS